jgi:hypothetical protein
MVGYHNLQNCGSWVRNISHPEHCSGHLRKGLRVPTPELELSTPADHLSVDSVTLKGNPWSLVCLHSMPQYPYSHKHDKQAVTS